MWLLRKAPDRHLKRLVLCLWSEGASETAKAGGLQALATGWSRPTTTQAMKRSPLRRSRRRVGAAAQKRIRAGGPLAKGRSSLSLPVWRALVAEATRLAGGRCLNPT